MTRLYANENFPWPVVVELRQFGHDVLTTHESGRAGIALPDDEILAFAVAEQRILLSINRKHFIRLHHQHPSHVGIIVCTFDLDFTALAQRIHTVLETQADMRGHLIRINRPG
jgi:Domain of unknown function (DUF5615)